MPGSVAASDAGSAWTVDRDAFNTHGHDRASAIADMQARLQAALLTTKMDVVQKTLLDAIDLEAEELEEAMLEVQAYMNRKETKGSKAPRFITDTSLRPVGPRPVSNGSLNHWSGTLVKRADNQFVLNSYSKRLSPDVVRSHMRSRASQLAKPHGSSGEYEEMSRRAKMSQMQAEIAKLSLANRRVRDLERLRETSGSMAPPQVTDMWRAAGSGPPRSNRPTEKSEHDVDIYAADAWLTPPPTGRESGITSRASAKLPPQEPEPEPEPVPEPVPEPEPELRSQPARKPDPEPVGRDIVLDMNTQNYGSAQSSTTREAAQFCRQLSTDINQMESDSVAGSRKAGSGLGGDGGFILGMSELRGEAQKVLDKGLGSSRG
jgi:hypothetical protein